MTADLRRPVRVKAPDTDRADDWRDRASCLTTDPEAFFPGSRAGRRATQDITEQRDAAKRVCHPCPSRDACLKWALDKPEEYGVWGGLDEDERRALKRRNNRKASQ